MSASALHQHLSASLKKVDDDVLKEFVKTLKKTYSNSLLAVVFYGSCMRTRKYDDAVLDFYVIVDGYHNAYANKWHAVLNKLLPPNVYFEQVQLNGNVIQAKYAVVSRQDLIKKTSSSAFHSYFWARFAQPIAIVYANNPNLLQWMVTVQQQSVQTMISKVSCMLEQGWTSKELWINALQLTYRAELRAEANTRAEEIYVNAADYFDGITAAISTDKIASELKTHRNKSMCKFRWRFRSFIGKWLSVLRLLKATTTFANGIDYIAWKIHRHTGESIQVNQRLRKFPWLFCWPLLWRLYRSNKIH